jgi:hypothetical protein
MENKAGGVLTQGVDRESEACLVQVAEQQDVIANRVSGVKFVLVVLSSYGIVFDREALRQQILLSYPDAVVFFQTTDGQAIGPLPPEGIDLLIDFTGPGQRQGWFYAKKLRKLARVTIGRNAGLFRKKIYDRIFDEKVNLDSLPQEALARERIVQKKVLALAGVMFVQAGETPPDRGKFIALELPPMQRI